MSGNSPSRREKADALQRVLHSRQFGKAARLRDFLQYVGRHALDSRTEEINETDIGRAVYQRPQDYTPAEDSIVRVEARNLRKKLEDYFDSDGKADPIVITIPKGTYVPRFDFRETVHPSLPADAAKPSRPRWAFIVVVAALVASVAGNLWLASSHWGGTEASPSGAPAPVESHALWSTLFRPGQETYVVLADSLCALAQDLAQRSLSLRDYQEPGFPSEDTFAGVSAPFDAFVREIHWRQYTSLTDTYLVAKIMQLPAASRATTSIRFARNMHTRDFKGRNVILLGSPRSNPWCELFEPQLNFKFEYDNRSGTAYIFNKNPRVGEERNYVAGGREDGSDEIYAVISLVPNLTNDGYVLMIAGTQMESTEAAGELLLNPKTTSSIVQDLGLESDGRLRPFEILVRSLSIEGTSRGASVVTHRILDEPSR